MTLIDGKEQIPEFELGVLHAQQKELRQYGRLHWFHWFVLAMSLVVTMIAWHLSTTFLSERITARFERESHRIVDLIQVRLTHYEDALFAGVNTLISHKGDMSRQQWHDYSKTLDLIDKYPGLNGIGLIREVSPAELRNFEKEQQKEWPDFHVHPPHDYPISLPIVYIEPEKSNLAAIGLDVAFEENRRTAALLARDIGTAQISGPITLVQDEGKTPGFLFYAPLDWTATGFGGLVYSPLVVKDFISGVFGKSQRQVYFTLQDGDTILYDEASDYPVENQSDALTTTLTTRLYGRDWKFTIRNAPDFVSTTEAVQPTLVLVSGLVIDALLLALFLMLTRSNRRVLDMAEAMTDRLGQQSSNLANKNSELESFAYIVSHDLKSPMLNIQSLVQFLEEDMSDFMVCKSSQAILDEHVQRVSEQTNRSLSLIKGVLDFSVIGHETAALEIVDVGKLVRQIGHSMGLSDKQLKILDPMPVLNSYPVRLTQVFENLIGNAYKYHPSPESATITVSAFEQEGGYRFLVDDDGLGIDVKYHEKIFKPFTKLQQHVSAQGCGIGLSIVRKTVENLGGKIAVLPKGEPGITFCVDWPIHHNEDSNWRHHDAA